MVQHLVKFVQVIRLHEQRLKVQRVPVMQAIPNLAQGQDLYAQLVAQGIIPQL